MGTTTNTENRRKLRHRRIRKNLRGTPRRPRLCVYKSNKHIYAQLVEDFSGNTLLGVSTLSPEIRDEIEGNNVEAAAKVGKLIARRCLENDIDQVVFDRGGYPYHGKVKALAESAREEGLNF
ncbi:MAG: 50S ribosomal protein L18 [Candidatus Acetothermia bacterium]